MDRPITSDRELQQEFETLAQNLENTTIDWKLRMKSLKRLQTIAQEGIWEFESFIPLFRRLLIHPMSAQVADLRSAIAKEACITIGVLAEMSRDNFDTCSERLVEVMGKVLGSATKVISNCVGDAVYSLLEHVITWRTIPKIIELYNSKNATMRTKAAGFLEFILKNYPPDIFESARIDLGPILENFIKTAVADASSDARAHGRGCYVEYEKLYPDRGNRLISGFDHQAVKLINELKGGGGRPTSALAKRSSPMVSAKKPKSRPVSALRSAQEKQIEQSPSQPDILGKPKRAPLNSLKKSENSSFGSDVGGTGGSSSSKPQKSHFTASPREETKANKGNIFTVSSQVEPQRQIHSPVNAQKRVQSPVNTQKRVQSPTGDTAKRVQSPTDMSKRNRHSDIVARKDVARNQYSQSPRDEPVRKPQPQSQPTRKDVGRNQYSQSPREEVKRNSMTTASTYKKDTWSTMAGASSQENLKPAKNQKESPRNFIQNRHSESPRQGAQRSKFNESPRHEPARNKPIMEQPKEDVKRPPTVPQQKQEAQRPRSQPNNLEFLIDKTYNDSWSTRYNAFERIERKLQDEEEAFTKSIKSNPVLWEKLVSAHIDHMADSHFKVSYTCITSLRQLTEIFAEKMSYHLENIIQKLLLCLGETKEQVISACQFYIDVVNDLYMAEDLLPLFLKYSSVDSKPKLKVKLFEIYADLVEKSDNYFDSIAIVRSYVKQVFTMIDPSSRQVSQAGVMALEAVKLKNPSGMLSTIFEMDSGHQKVMRRLFRENAPHIEEDIKQYMSQSGLPMSPQSSSPRTSASSVPSLANQNSNLAINIIMQLKSPGSVRFEGLQRVQGLNREANPDIWQNMFTEIVSTIIECLHDESFHIREATLNLLKEIFHIQVSLVRDNLHLLIDNISQCLYFTERTMQKGGEEVLEALLNSQDSGEIIPVILTVLTKQTCPALQGLIRQLTKIIKHSKKQILVRLMGKSMSVLKSLFTHTNADVRKSVVF